MPHYIQSNATAIGFSPRDLAVKRYGGPGAAVAPRRAPSKPFPTLLVVGGAGAALVLYILMRRKK